MRLTTALLLLLFGGRAHAHDTWLLPERFRVGAAAAAPHEPLLLRTDAQGRVSLRLGQAGPWMLRVTRIVPSSARAGEWDSVFTTLTLDVLPKAR